MNLLMMALQIPYAMIKLIAAVVAYIKVQTEINNAASSFSKYGACSSIPSGKVGMHCYACKLRVYNKYKQ